MSFEGQQVVIGNTLDQPAIGAPKIKQQPLKATSKHCSDLFIVTITIIIIIIIIIR